MTDVGLAVPVFDAHTHLDAMAHRAGVAADSGFVTTVMDLGFKSNPSMHRGPRSGTISSADRSRANVGGAGQDFLERL